MRDAVLRRSPVGRPALVAALYVVGASALLMQVTSGGSAEGVTAPAETSVSRLATVAVRIVGEDERSTALCQVTPDRVGSDTLLVRSQAQQDELLRALGCLRKEYPA